MVFSTGQSHRVDLPFDKSVSVATMSLLQAQILHVQGPHLPGVQPRFKTLCLSNKLFRCSKAMRLHNIAENLRQSQGARILGPTRNHSDRGHSHISRFWRSNPAIVQNQNCRNHTPSERLKKAHLITASLMTQAPGTLFFHEDILPLL